MALKGKEGGLGMKLRGTGLAYHVQNPEINHHHCKEY
jgi:hypothetical protein